MAHQKIRAVGLWCVTISANAQGKESPTQSPETYMGRRSCMKDALIAWKKTKYTRIKCSSTDIQKENCKAGTLEWEKASVIMQDTINHIDHMNRFGKAEH